MQKAFVERILEYWKHHDIFKKSLEQRSAHLQTKTFDGPPFASGSPHYGHGLASTMKDTLLRYKTMKGHLINRDWGWDCHGLPVEKAVEKNLGLDGKRDIEEKLGVKKFTDECRAYVNNVSDEWRWFVDHLGRWADMDHAYYTMDLSFMESVLWVFQSMYNKNLVYKGFKVQWYCPSCATTLANNEVNEGYQDRQDPAITIKFAVRKLDDGFRALFEATEDGFIEVVDCALKRDNKFFMFYHKKGQKYVFPGGKIDKGHTLEQTVTKELAEEVGGIEVTSMKSLGSFKEIMPYGLFNLNVVDVEFTGEPQNLEPEKHTHFVWAEIIPSDNSLGMAVKIENTIVDDADEIISQFYDLYIYHQQIPQKIDELCGSKSPSVNFLAWTTTPWTLPSNMFLALGKHIEYVTVFDLNSKEYYILAESLLKTYYKDPKEYFLINRVKGEKLAGVAYTPLLPYIDQSTISDTYKQQFFKTILGEFVSTEDGTGIVHIAPSFGVDDFEAVAAFLPREDAKNWLFLPVDDYGEFTDEVSDYKGVRVYEANKDIIARLKTEGKLIGQKSYNHSYPHCRRCDTPLISKAVTSWFIKEQELAKDTVPQAEKTNFVPNSIQNRFRDTLASAPDWNLSRNRYRGSPLPIWENQNNLEDKIVIGTLDELYIHSKTGSKNISKHIFIRHAQTDYNGNKLCDSFGKPVLTEKGQQQAEELVEKLTQQTNKEQVFLVLSPLQRTWLTIKPFLSTIYTPQELEDLEKKYLEITTHYQEIWNSGNIIEHLQDEKQNHVFAVSENIAVDFRLTDHISPDIQDKFCSCDTLNRYDHEKPISGTGESVALMLKRTASSMSYRTQQNQDKITLYVSHNDTLAMSRNYFRKKDYKLYRTTLLFNNADVKVHYRDTEAQKEVDLHKPYIDNYWFSYHGNTYKRIPEVMDCWFESGAMPFGQCGYTGENNPITLTKPFEYPADFIIEGLDQTRGWFRTLHVLGNAVTNKNSFNNVLVNGMILAEDGRKMSKSLKNYPDPKDVFEKYGADAYRLYLLSSPAVRAEPVRFVEKGVDQILKDFTSAFLNAYKFFETYAKVDGFKVDMPSIYFLRHAKAEAGEDGKLTSEGKEQLQDKGFIEKILSAEIESIYCSPLARAKETAEIIKSIYAKYRSKDIEIIIDTTLTETTSLENTHQKILSGGKKNVLLVAHLPQIQQLWSSYYQGEKITFHTAELIKLPSVPLINELDKWIMSVLHSLILDVEKSMENYQLDTAAKSLLSFIDHLNNWYIRRSRRRFWANGMDNDKKSAYLTLFEILDTYARLVAPFAPFVSEHIFLQLQQFVSAPLEGDSIHLHHYPLGSHHYINQDLIDEITLVRRVISLGLFLRSKNKIAIKQPLQKIELKME